MKEKYQKILLQEGLNDWKIIIKKRGGGGNCSFSKKEIILDTKHKDNFGLFLHELAHAVSGKKHYENDGILMDTMARLINKYTNF